MTAVRKQDMWMISSVVDEHNHDVSPTKSRLIRGNRKLNMQVKRTLDLNDQAGVRINKSFRSLVCDAGGFENLQFVERDARNYIGKQRRALGKEGDGQALLNHFSAMRELNKDFFFEIDMDPDNRISNVFWADARSRAAFMEFGDVVSFDTTYLTNKYDMPFAPFVGVNHHGHSILLGCGLLSAEDSSTFVWLFRCWLRCMGNKSPEGIVTDQCKAMQNAIQMVFPNTRHRWCLWHIMKKLPEKLIGYTNYKEIKHTMKQLVYESSTAEDFESGWNNFIELYDLELNEWLHTLFEERHRWVPCYLKCDFWAGMSTTQRSEGMNAFFDGFINSTTTLQQFVVQYDNALRSKAEKEYEADFSSVNTTIPCGSQSFIERQFQEEYTHAKFGEVQNEFRCKMNCNVKNVVFDGIRTKYFVKEALIWKDESADKMREVIFDPSTKDIECSCRLFEFRGILCRHSLMVLAQEDVRCVSQKYILGRWSKQIRRWHTLIRASYNTKKDEPNVKRYDFLCKKFYDIAELACESQSGTDFLVDQLESLSKNASIRDAGATSLGAQKDMSSTPNTAVEHNNILSPVHVKRKGRPRGLRMQSTVEKIGKKKNM
ncbi:protein FAR-RED IMPAIRED RESPONSE 1-like [Vigna unguiculata]|uniref:protein FAR-RED IMPAIRED RESPONSE 1-like n=1 Tax=Vigna unguiculata TaxID=3917 RepID=UPI001016825A|nr:protein FAR-RED IMPAIRED RESPONSE 1-like [Vigna unguiculata]